jgi:TatD DNase family protein
MRRYPNLKVGFTPMITYAKNRHLHDVVRKIPLSRILLETDSPYFLPRQEPISLTGGMSHPGYVIHTAAQIAHLKEVPIRGEPFFETKWR